MINQETVVEINLSNLKKNLDFLKSKYKLYFYCDKLLLVHHQCRKFLELYPL